MVKKNGKKICLFLGSRAQYSSARPIMRAIAVDPDLSLVLFAGASTVLDKYGDAVSLMRADGFAPDEILLTIVEGGTPASMAKSAGLVLLELPALLEKHAPDIVLVVGDRYEMLSVAAAAALMNIPVAHTMGGEVSGTIDESIRHAITKLAHLHLPATPSARRNIIRMGEDPRFVIRVGCPRMDAIREALKQSAATKTRALLQSSEGVGETLDTENGFILVSQHPVTTEFEKSERHMAETLAAVKEVGESAGLDAIVLWPNADAGTDDISRAIRKFRERGGMRGLRLFKNLPLDIYIYLMKKTRCLVGNSSSGIRDGAFIGTPVVNIGSRQRGREKGPNVVDCRNERRDIARAVRRQLAHGPYRPHFLYGDGKASARIVRALKRPLPPVQKTLAYR